MREEVCKDTRLLDALEYIDDEYIASAARYKMKLKTEPNMSSKMTWRTPFKHWKQFVALAACLILLSAALPVVVRFVSSISDFIAGWGSITETSEEPETTNGMYDEYILTEEDLAELNEAYLKKKIQIEGAPDMDEEAFNEWKNSKYATFAQTVDEAMIRTTGRPSSFYFGKYSECIVIAFNSMVPINRDFELNGYNFSNRYITMVACFDATLYYIPQAYEMGLLDDEDIEKLYILYEEYY